MSRWTFGSKMQAPEMTKRGETGRLSSSPNSSAHSPKRVLSYLLSLQKTNPESYQRLISLYQAQLPLKLTKYIPHTPTAKQAAFLVLPHREALYGGAAGGGKSDALLMAALQYVDVAGYHALILRKTYADLALPGAIMDRSHDWLRGSDARWNDKEKTWLFPSGSTLTFGYLQTANDKYRYQGAEFQFIAPDELTQFAENDYRYLFSRLRKLKGQPVPVRMRAASNPGGQGHEWVKRRFLDEGISKGRPFIRARLDDNPYLDAREYEQSLAELDPVTRLQLLMGDWSARSTGGYFSRAWFKVVQARPSDRSIRWVRFWDLAATEEKPGKDPDWTVGALVGLHLNEGWYCIADIQRARLSPRGVEQLVRNTAVMDGAGVETWMEQEPGSSGVNTIDHYARKVLQGFNFRGLKTSGSKVLRAGPFSSACEAGNVQIVAAHGRATWISDFFDECEGFPVGHDDQVDAVSGAFEVLKAGGVGIRWV